jgi:hypothetical protein
MRFSPLKRSFWLCVSKFHKDDFKELSSTALFEPNNAWQAFAKLVYPLEFTSPCLAHSINELRKFSSICNTNLKVKAIVTENIWVEKCSGRGFEAKIAQEHL